MSTVNTSILRLNAVEEVRQLSRKVSLDKFTKMVEAHKTYVQDRLGTDYFQVFTTLLVVSYRLEKDGDDA